MTLKEHLSISRRSIRLLYSMSRRYFLSTVFANIITSVTPYVPIYFSARLIDALSAGAGVRTLALYASLTVGLVAALSLIGAVLKAQQEIGQKQLIGSDYDWLFAEKSMQLPYAAIEDREVALMKERIIVECSTGYSLFYLTRCIEQYVSYLTRALASVCLTVSFFTIGSVAPGAKLAFAFGTALTIAAGIWINEKSSKLRMTYFSGCTVYNTLLNKLVQYFEHYTSGKDIRLYAMEDSLARYMDDKVYGSLCDGEQRMQLRCAGLKLISTVMNYLLRFGVYLLLISASLAGGLSVGSIARYVSCVMLLLTAVSGLVGTVQLSLINHGYIRRFFEYFDIPNPMYQGSLSVEKREDNDYSIEFKDVSFKYPNSDVYALRHVSLKFRIGEKLAVVGMNGSGKTTFIKLLCRLYDPTEGEILLNGVDIRKYNYQEYMAIFSVVFQDFQLFAFSLGQNVAAGAEYDPSRAEACLKEAGFGKRLAEMPRGLDTFLYRSYDPSGVEISGGEAQKIAIARALYKNAPFIVLDEPTAALDPVSEYEVYRKFSEISGGKTAIYISHRLASCRFCDDILVFNEGQIVQHGTHEALLAQKDGKYAALWNAQAQYYTEKA